MLATQAHGQLRENDLNREITALKAENAAVREQLHKLEEQQKTLLELVQSLQPAPLAAPSAANPTPEPSNPNVPIERKAADRYQDGIVIWQTDDDATVPFLMSFSARDSHRASGRVASRSMG
jgi:hypothetical protein